MEPLHKPAVSEVATDWLMTYPEPNLGVALTDRYLFGAGLPIWLNGSAEPA